MNKICVLDTSILIYDPHAYRQFPDSTVIIPIAVLNELDNLKKGSSQSGRNARVAIKSLDEISDRGDISVGILLDNNVMLKVDANYIDLNDVSYRGFGDPTYGDTQILACAYVNWLQNHETTLISNDINLRIKAKSRGIDAQAHESTKFSLTDLYSGAQLVRDEEAGLDLQRQGFIDPRCYGLKLNPHECVMFESDTGDGIAMGRKIAPDKLKVIKKFYPWNIAARNKEQTYAIDLMMDPTVDLITLIGSAGTGKAQPIDSKILTPNGWTTMGQITVGSTIINSSGVEQKVLGVFPQGVKDIYEISFTDGSSTQSCEDHLWHTYTQKDRDSKRNGSVKTLKDIKSSLRYGKYNKRNHSIPLVNPIQFKNKKVPIDPYLLGVLLGDAYIGKHVELISADPEIIKICTDLLPEGLSFKKINDIHFVISKLQRNNKPNILYNSLLELNVNKKSSEKFVPDIYKFNSIDVRIAVLQGLMDTDGSPGKLNKTENVFYTTSLKLAEDVQFLCQSLGGTANIKNKQTYYTYKNKKIKGKPSFAVHLVVPNGTKLYRLARKSRHQKDRTKYFPRRYIDSIKYVGKKEAQCILVDSVDRLYVTDNCILTHNTLITLATALELVLNRKQYDKFIIYRPIQPVGNDIGYLPGEMSEKLAPWFQAIMDNFEVLFTNKTGNDWRRELEVYQKKGRIEMEAITYIRGRSIPNAIILVDEAQNLSREDVKTILTRAGENTKIILTGDIEQIDNSVLDATSNGLTHVIEKFKDSDLAGHITFTRGERSKLASQAAEIL